MMMQQAKKAWSFNAGKLLHFLFINNGNGRWVGKFDTTFMGGLEIIF